LLARARPGRTVTAARAAAAGPERPRAARGLQAYRGDPVPPSLALTDLEGRTFRLEDLRGRVVLVNFWASWCPPCVREMPSMQRLREKMAGQPFEILAVNMAEPERMVREFLDSKIRVDFPILLDRDGAVLQHWKVFVFPTSYVIGPDGTIRLGAFGELEWDAPETLEQLGALLPARRENHP
jgi:thiol-disulfide isomerase/thioredoxin